MYYPKRAKIKDLQKSHYEVYDFSSGANFSQDKKVTPLYKATLSYNYNFKSGALRDGKGIKTCYFGEQQRAPIMRFANAKRLYYFKTYNQESESYDEHLLIYAEDKKMYHVNPYVNNYFLEIKDLYFNSEPTAVRYTYNGSDSIIFTADGVMKVFDGNTVATITDAPCLTSTCIHSERLFATEDGQKTTLWFSDDFDPLNWNIGLDDAGFIDLRDDRGSLIKVISFGGFVYVFRNYGITRVTAFGDQREFTADGVSTSSGKIYKDSITICGDRVIYLAEDGFYRFSGGTPVRILTELDECLQGVDNSSAKGQYYNGNFYALIKLKMGGEVQRYMVCYQLSDSTLTVCKNLNVTDFLVMEGEKDFKLLFLCEDKNSLGELSERAEYFGNPLAKRWQSGEVDFSKCGEKVVSAVTLTTKTQLSLTIESDLGRRTVHFLGASKPQRIAIGLKGHYFTFRLDCKIANCNIARLRVDYEYFKE